MGTKVHCKSYLPGYYHSMRDLNEDSSSSSWPICCGNKATVNGQYYNGLMQSTTTDGYPGYGKDALKHKMLEHEAVFKNQVYELHRLYQIQRDMMEEAKRNELQRFRASMEQPSSSSSHKGPQVQSQDSRKWHMAGFPLLNSGYAITSISGVDIENSPMSCTKGHNNAQPYHFSFQNGSSLKESEPSDSRPLKMRKKLFDLQVQADEYVDTEEGGKLSEIKLRSGSIRLADLNEPVEIEEQPMAPSTIDFLVHGSINGENKGESRQLDKLNAGYLGINGERLHTVGSKVNEMGWFSHLHEAGLSKSNLSSVTHGLEKEKMHTPSQPFSGSDPLFSSCYASSRPHLVPHLANPTSSFTQKLITATKSCLDSPRSLHISAQIGENRLVSASSKSNHPRFVSELTSKNGFYHGSPSKSNGTDVCLPSAGDLNYLERGWAGKSKTVLDIDLNEAEDVKSKTILPWLTHKPAHANETAITDLNQLLSDYEKVTTKKETSEAESAKKIPGFPIFETGSSGNGPSLASIGCSRNKGREKKDRIIDINLECEPDEEIAAAILIVEKEKMETKGPFIREYIDLNSCVSDFLEDEASAPTSSDKIAFEIDLEAPAKNEYDINKPSEESTTAEASLHLLQNNGMLQDRVLKNAAEVMVAISSSSCPKIHSDGNLHCSDASLSESLMWFAEACTDEFERKASTVRDGHNVPPREMSVELDDFEAMTLQIQETREEDHVRAPFVSKFQNFEETPPANNNALAARSRRGQSRRGRQRRDFQRDILPGLVSLSRHEMTEDIQMFGGLMRATGHHWVSGLTRRNGGGRGRRRAVIESVLAISGSVKQACTPLAVQVGNNIEGGLEDRSLTGWGKTTRRPRRQRCPTGNNSNLRAVVLT
ncbi:hypothetical protein OROGR_000478 [Orobanche gracilis]